jgi:hypothetical protein
VKHVLLKNKQSLKQMLLILLATVTVAAAQVPGKVYRLPRQVNAASTPGGARFVHNFNLRHNMEDMQAWNQDTVKAYQQNEIRTLQAGTTVMIDKVEGDVTAFRVGQNPAELYALSSDLK